MGTGLTAPRIDDPRAQPAPGDGYFYLVRAGNACGAGTFGDSSIQPDPRDLIDATLPAACSALVGEGAMHDLIVVCDPSPANAIAESRSMVAASRQVSAKK